jgi:hypothetical protein
MIPIAIATPVEETQETQERQESQESQESQEIYAINIQEEIVQTRQENMGIIKICHALGCLAFWILFLVFILKLN